MQVRIDATCSVVLPKIDSIYYNELIYSQITSHFLYKQSTWQHLSKSVNNKQHYYITLFTHKLDTPEMACNNVNYIRIGSICAQGCQLPDFSLRSQTFCYTADFSATFFYICLKPRLFGTSHYKTTSKHLKIQEFLLYFAKKFCNFRQKQEKRPHPTGSFCAWAGQGLR